jgi:hypothetical protein
MESKKKIKSILRNVDDLFILSCYLNARLLNAIGFKTRCDCNLIRGCLHPSRA